MNPSAYNDRSTFIRRLAYFLIGTAIGLFILGIVKEQKKRAMQNAQPPANQSPAAPANVPAAK
jgi:hypothetical protein